MNFRRIFLVKCLLLLFPSVKCFDLLLQISTCSRGGDSTSLEITSQQSFPKSQLTRDGSCKDGSSTRRVYKAVNETALLSISAPGSVYEATWWKGEQRLVQIRGNTAKHYVNKDQCRCMILRNGTLQIQHVVKEDSGNYRVTVYQENGKLKAEENIMFFVQEPVPQPILRAECGNKTAIVRCEVKQKAKDEAFVIELTQPNGKKIQKNATMLELHTQHSGTFRCLVKNEASEKMSEKVIKCSGKLDFYLILSIAGGAIFFVIFVSCLIYYIRRKKTKRREDYDEERVMQTLQGGRERAVRELAPAPSHPTPKQLRVQQRPLPQPQPQAPQQALPPRPRPRTQPRTPNLPRERP